MARIQYTTEIISSYLFDQLSLPTNLVDNDLIRASNAKGDDVKIDATWYMTAGPGRFALPSLSPLVQAFFARDSQGNYLHQLAGRATPYTKSELANQSGTGLLPIDTVQFEFQQYEYDDGADNIAERSYIWNSTGFSIPNVAQFYVDPSTGERSIGNLKIQSLHTIDSNRYPEENFDYDSDDWLAYIDSLLGISQDRLDPSRIGRKVSFDFDGSQWPTMTGSATGGGYGVAEFDQDVAKELANRGALFGANFVTSGLALHNQTIEFLQDLFDNGPARFLDHEDRPILYGTLDGDTLDANDAEDFPFFKDGGYVENGVVIVAGDGTDIVYGTKKDDALYGGKGDDTFEAGGSINPLNSNDYYSSGDDLIHGGGIGIHWSADGVDTVNYGSTLGLADGAPLVITFVPANASAGQGTAIEVTEDGFGGTDTLFSIERIFATSGDDEVKFTTLQALESLTNVIIDGGSETKYDLLDFSNFTGTLDASTLQLVDGELTIGGVTFKDFEELRDTQKSGRIFGTQSTPAPPPPPPPEGEDPPPPPPSPEQLLQPIIDKVLDSTTRGPDASNPMSRALNILLAEDYQALANIKAVFGGEGDDFIAADAGVLEIRGEAGDDLLIATNALYAPAVAGDDDTPPQPEQRVTIDGGSDNDAVVALFGEKALTVGGEGRDWIWNRSAGGELYGDTFSGVSATPDGDGNPVAVDYDDPANADNFWWWPDTTIKDAQSNDVLQFFGLPLTGGVQGLPLIAGGGAAALFTPSAGLFSDDAFNNEQGHFFVDNFLVSMNYVFKKDADGNNTLYVVNALDGLMGLFSDVSFEQTSDGSNIRGAMTVENYTITYSAWGFGLNEAVEQGITGDLNMVFKLENKFLAALAWLPPTPGLGGLGKLLPLIDEAASLKAFASLYEKSLSWVDGADPLVLDLDGDGIETVSLGDSNVYFDHDGDFFAEKTGWLSGDDGFLALDKDGNGRIDDISELFGGVGLSGFGVLGVYDEAANGGNGDGVIDAGDLIWSELRVWQDVDQDGESAASELSTLEDLGIVSISLNSSALDIVTPQGTTLVGTSTFARADGSTGNAFDAVFELNDVDTRYLGETGKAPWLADNALNSKGFGRLADLAVVASNDFEVADLVTQAAQSMTVPKLKTLREQSGDALGAWAYALDLTRELTPVLVETAGDGAVTLVDRGVYVEDASGGYWTLKSGQDVLDGDGNAIARATLEDVLAQGASSGQTWQVEQAFSPSSRDDALSHRVEAPYLAELIDGRAQIIDYGFQHADGSWRLASGADVVDGDGAVIALPTLDDVLAQAAPDGHEWRQESIGFNPYGFIEVEHIGINFIDGVVVDYTVEVTDRDGTFFVWARNLDRALELQDKQGTARNFNLRNFEIDFETLDEVGSTDDSQFRVELLTPAQLQFATSVGGVDFRPEILSATINDADGTIAYAVNDTGEASISAEEFDSGIDTVIDLLGVLMDQYLLASRSFAVRLALQGGLSDFARGLEYNGDLDKFQATEDNSRQLAPLFEAIFESAPAGYDPAYDYLTDWNELLAYIYTDFKLDSSVNLYGTTVQIDQPWILQMLLPAFENVGIDLDLLAAMNALGLDETRLIEHAPDATEVNGTNGIDFFYMSEGNQTYDGGFGSDHYFVGKDIGTADLDDGVNLILDQDDGDVDDLRFTDITSDQVTAIRDGQDLILEIAGRDDVIRINDQFLGELNPFLSNGTQLESGVSSIIFADGEIWDRFRMSFEVADPQDTNDAYVGSGSADVLWGGKGNDNLEGGWGGDIYIYERGDGQDVIDDAGGFSFGAVQAGLDFLHFRGDISSEDLKLTRDGDSEDLLISLLDEDGNVTADTITIEKQFGGIALNFQAFSAIDPNLGIDYIAPGMIERFIFGDGTSIDFEETVERVLENAKTDSDDAIYGFINGNTLDGGAGDDFLTGKQGSDTYIFGRAYGQDVIEDLDYSSKLFGDTPDKLRFVDDLRWTDFDFLRDGSSDTLTMRVTGTDDQVTLADFNKEILLIGFVNRIETIEFGDGTEWSYLKFLQHYIDIAKTSGDDHIYGFVLGDYIDGGAGNDRLEGLGGNDSYVFARGYGEDTILDINIHPNVGFTNGGEDSLILEGIASGDVTFSRTDLDLIITVNDTGEKVVLENQYVRDHLQGYAIEILEFSDQTLEFTNLNPEDLDLVGTNAGETITGSNFSETIDGRGGDDTLVGGDGGDRYKFDAGYGQDVIIDTRVRASWRDREGINVPVDDVVEFGDDITQADAVFSKDGNDLVVSVQGRTDTLRIRDQFVGTIHGVERFEFQDGSFLLISDVEEILQIVGGNRGDNVIEGVPDQPNTLDGRQGDDTLVGGSAADTYAFGAGYDFDRVEEQQDSTGVIDRIIFGTTVQSDSLIVRRDGDDLLIDLGSGTDVLTIVGGLASTRVEEFHFADGSILTIDDLLNRLTIGTDGDDQLIGFDDRSETLSGGAGSDALEGKTGDDSYEFGFGDGRDSILETGGVDQVQFGVGVTRDQISFADIDGDLLISLTGTGENIVVLGGASNDLDALVETFVFDSGDVLTLEDVRTIIRDSVNSAAQNLIDGTTEAEGLNVVPGGGFDTVKMGPDTRVVFSSGDGIDRIEVPTSVSGAEIVISDLSATQAEVRVGDLDGRDLIIAFPETGDQLVLVDALLKSALPTITFPGGIVWDRATLIAQSIREQTGPEADIIFGSATADTIEGGRGNDDIQGGGGDDTYVFTQGDGRDVIADTSGFDRLEVKGYRQDDLTVTRPVADRDDLLLSFTDSDDEILIKPAGIDVVVFGDGSELTIVALQELAVGQGTPFDDVINGSDTANTLAGGPGNDTLIGQDGSDAYIYARGDGRDIIDDQGRFDDVNELIIHDYAPGDVTIVRHDDRLDDVVLRFTVTDEIVIRGGFVDNGRHLAKVTFEDGTQWTFADLISAFEAQPDATSGDDTLIGDSSANVLAGGAGNDYLSGDNGSDTYIFNRGDGSDIILEDGAGSTDRLELRGYLPSEVILSQVGTGADLRIQFAGTSDQIVVRDTLGGSFINQIEEIAFEDGTTWPIATVRSMVFTNAATSGDDAIVGGRATDTLSGGAGNDYLSGQNGSDTYVFNRGDGSDVILEGGAGSTDRLELRGYLPSEVTLTQVGDTSDLRIQFAGTSDQIVVRDTLGGSFINQIEEIAFDDGTTWPIATVRSTVFTNAATPGDDSIIGSGANDTLAGGIGNDYLSGQNGSDTYVFNRGDGNDTIFDNGNSAGTDRLELHGYTPSEVVLSKVHSGADLRLSFVGTSDQIVVRDTLGGSSANQIEEITFDDGTTWTMADVIAALAGSTPSVIEGTSADETLTSLASDDYLTGGDGSDIYAFTRGDGKDVIDENGFNDTDQIAIHGYTPSEVVVSRSGDTDDLRIGFVGTDDEIVVRNTLGGDIRDQIEQIAFDDGTVWSAETVRTMVLATHSTSGNDTVVGGAQNETLSGGLGNDYLSGGDGSDVYDFTRGDGKDVIDENGFNDTDQIAIHGYTPNEVMLSRVGNTDDLRISFANSDDEIVVIGTLDSSTDQIEQIIFDDGTVWTAETVRTMVLATHSTSGNDTVVGGAQNETLSGGLGNDYLSGGDGSDVYDFTRGDGKDVIDDNGFNDTDQIAIHGYTPNEVMLSRVGNTDDLRISFANSDDEIVVIGTLDSSTDQIEQIIFDDGTVWTSDEVSQRLIADQATDGDDNVEGFGTDDTLAGGAGHDVLTGGNGNDTYIYARGDGNDLIVETTFNSGDQLRLIGIDPNDVKLQRGVDNDLEVIVVESAPGVDDSGRITARASFTGTSSRGIESIVFDDGTVWLRADFETLADRNQATVGADRLTGTTLDDTIEGLAGDDLLIGLDGADTYRYTRGDGKDTIRDSGSGTDLLEISGYTQSEVTFDRRGIEGKDLVIRLADEGDEITIIGGLDGSAADRIETIALLDDDLTLTLAQVQAELLLNQATSGDDLIVGTTGDDILAGGAGNDLLSGGLGDDTYQYAAGDGDDRISDVGNSFDTVELTDYTSDDVIFALRAGPESLDLVVRLAGDRERLVLENALAEGSIGIEQLVFSDGEVWDRASLRERALSDVDTLSNDFVYGFDGNDTLNAEAGDDYMSGGKGSDVYRFQRGDGHDTIDDTEATGSAVDRVEFLNVVSSEVSVTRLFKGSDAIVFNFTTSDTDSLTVIDGLADDGKGIEEYTFTDGVTWSKSTIETLLDNNAPVAVNDGFFTATSGEAITILAPTLLRNDFDADGDALSLIYVDGGTDGIAELDAEGNVRFTANADFSGPTQITYKISDGRNGIAEASVDVRVRPVAEARDDDGFTVAEDGFLTIRTERLLSNDVDGDRMIVAQVFGAENGTASLASNGEITFTPDADFNGFARFVYVANTPEGGRAEAQVLIEVTAVNDAPVGVDDPGFTTLEDTPFQIVASDLLANDTDVDGDALVVASVLSSANLTVELTDDGVILVSPRDYFFGDTFFNYVVTDPDGATATGRVDVFVTPVNNAPEPQNDYFDADNGQPIREDNPIVITVEELTANDIDRDGDPLVVTSVQNSVGGTAELLPNGTVLFTPQDNFNGEATFDYTVDDREGAQASATATVVYQPVNDNPIANDDRYDSPQDPSLAMTLSGLEDTPLEIPIVELLKNDADVEGLVISFESASSGIDGDVVVTDHDTVIFTPDQDYWGEATFTYLISDPDGAVDAADVTLYFENVGDAPPEAVTDIINVFEDVPTLIPISVLLGNDTDIDRDTIEFVSWRLPTASEELANGPLNGVVLENADGDLVFTPDLNSVTSSGFYYSVTDGSDGVTEGFVDIVMIPLNDQPVAVADNGGITQLDVPLVLRVSDLLENDFDIDEDDVVSFVGVDNASVGSFEIVDANGEQFITLRVADGFTGDVTLQYRVTDLAGFEDVGSITATVATTYNGFITGTPLLDLLLGTPGDDNISAFEGADVIEAGGGDDLIFGGDDGDTIDGGAGVDVVDFEGSNTGVRADLTSRVGQGGFAQGDTYLNVEGLAGTDFNDTLGGDGASNTLDGRAGHDRLEGRDGADTLRGREGNDSLEGGLGADIVDGGAGSDTADYFSSSAAVDVSLSNGTATGGDAEGDTLIDIENITGTDFADTLEGNDEANILSGGRDDDTLIGNAGDDTLIGGRGGDALIGGEGVDIADYALSNTGVTIDMVDGSAGSGDAEGDTFSSIEIVQGSNQDDIIRGDDSDNILRGRLGADILDGRGGFDIADYTGADEAVSVDLSLGQGLAGEALGDQLISIEMLRGTTFADTFVGSAGNDVFDGGFGDDAISGGAGSDQYLFGFDSSADTVTENGDASDTDSVIMGALIRPKDVSVIRQGDDLFLELERDDGFLIDTLLVTNHFVGRETGIEEIVFADGTVWDRARIDDLQRVGRFNAEDDIYRLAVEDEVASISVDDLISNDASEGVDQLEVISVQNAINGAATLLAEGTVSFLGDQDFNGDAFFEYTVRDQFGRESTAEVEVNLAPVNDAPVGVNDGIIHGIEDEVLLIPFADLVANDIDVDGDILTIIGPIGPLYDEDGNPLNTTFALDGTNGKGRVTSGFVEFDPFEDHFGFAGFTYTVSDPDGLTSTAAVELFFDPVNDAPRSGIDDTDKITIRLQTTTTITVQSLLANDFDVEGDDFTFEGIHSGGIHAPTNGTAIYDEAADEITFTPDELGQATFAYDLLDARGARSTITVELTVIPLNDPPIANDDSGFTTLEDAALVIDPADLLANDTDPNDDTLVLDSVERFPLNGKVSINQDGMVVFTPRSDYNGEAGFVYHISDGEGGFDEAFVAITVLPRNDAAILRDDLVEGLEDEPIFVIAAEAFGNDIEPDGDVIFFEDATIVGILEATYLTTPDVSVSAALTDGSVLPAWLSFDDQTLTFQGLMPLSVVDPVNVTLTFDYPQQGLSFARDLSFTQNDFEALADGYVYDGDLADSYDVRTPYEESYEFTADTLSADTTVVAELATPDINGETDLPSWLIFDAATLSFSGTPPVDVTSAFDVSLIFTRPIALGEEAVFNDTVSIDPTDPDLLEGIAYNSDVALLDISAGSFSARLANGRALPSWLDFDVEQMRLEKTEIAPEPGEDVARIQVLFTPDPETLADDTYAATTRGFALEFTVDPALPLDPLLNAMLANNAYFASQGVLALDLGAAQSVTAQQEARIDLPEWLSFDAETLGFVGAPLESYVGAVPIRLDVEGNGSELPTFSVITDLVVDETYTIDTDFGVPDEFLLRVASERLDLFRPEDFNGVVAVDYNTTDDKGAISEAPGTIIVNVLAQPEVPTPDEDAVEAIEDQSVTFAVSDLLANDIDVDGDAFHAIAFAQPEHGVLEVHLATVEVDAPSTLPTLTDGVYSAILRDGSDLPDWMSLEGATGRITATPPFAFKQALSILVTVTDGTTSQTELLRPAFDGNTGATLTYTPTPSYNGADQFTYTITDDLQGSADGRVEINVLAVNDPPTANEDSLDGFEDIVLVIDPTTLLANDIDVDGDPLTLTGVLNPVNGLVVFENGEVAFTPTPNFDGDASFDYVVSDGVDGESVGHVEINVQSTNVAPIATTDVIEAIEDEAITITIADLLANDSDPDGDTFEFISIESSVDDARSFILPDGRIQFVPDENINGLVTFNYEITDGRLSSTGQVQLNFAAVNDGPIAIDDGVFTGDEDVPVVIDLATLLSNDRDVEGDTFSVDAVFDGENGDVVISGDNAVFTPRADYFGNAGFTYRVVDSGGASSTGFVAITLLPADDLPIAVSDAGYEVFEDSFIDIDPAELLANDFDPDGDDIIFLSALTDGAFRVEPAADFFGELVVTYEITDGSGIPVQTTVTLNVLPLPDAPVAVNDELDMIEDTPLTILISDLLDNDIDVDFDALLFRSVILEDGVSVQNNGIGQLIVTPDADLNGPASFRYEIEDSTGLVSSANVEIAIDAVNDAPVIGVVPDLSGTEDTAFTATLAANLFTDVDGDALAPRTVGVRCRWRWLCAAGVARLRCCDADIVWHAAARL